MKNMNLRVLELCESLKNAERFRLHPNAVFESEFVASSSDDIEKKKETDKFTKRLRVMMPDMDKMHELRSQIVNCLAGFPVLFKIVNTNFGYSALAKQYSALEKSLKAYSKFMKSMKSHSKVTKSPNKNSELIEFAKDFDYICEINVFTMMLEDLEVLSKEVDSRIEEHKKAHPEFVPMSEVSAGIDFEVVKAAYKSK